MHYAEFSAKYEKPASHHKVRKMHKTDKKNFENLFQSYQGLLRKASSQHYLRSLKDEAYAQASLSFCEAVYKFDEKAGVPFAGYVKAKIHGDLYTLFKRHRRNWLREISADGSTAEILSPRLSAPSPENSTAEKIFIAQMLQKLPLRQRQIIEYTILQKYTQKETAAMLRISQQAVAANQKQALAGLKKMFSEEFAKIFLT